MICLEYKSDSHCDNFSVGNSFLNNDMVENHYMLTRSYTIILTKKPVVVSIRRL